MKLACLLTLLLSVMARFATAQETIALRGLAQNEQGIAVEGVSISHQWVPDGKTESGPVKLKPYKGAVSDKNGRFILEVSATPGMKIGLMALSADKSLGWIGAIEPDSIKELRVILRPMRTLRLRATVEDVAGSPEFTNGVVWIGDRSGPVITQIYTHAPLFELALPQNNYSISVEAKDSQPVRKEVDLRAGDVNLGEIKLKRAILLSLIGKTTPPLEFTESRGVPSSFKVEDLRGKWVILEFWGFW